MTLYIPNQTNQWQYKQQKSWASPQEKDKSNLSQSIDLEGSQRWKDQIEHSPTLGILKQQFIEFDIWAETKKIRERSSQIFSEGVQDQIFRIVNIRRFTFTLRRGFVSIKPNEKHQ